jgi:MOSC domain-containing protein
MLIGSVTGLWRYPVKSMQGERLQSASAGLRGLAGDRGWAVIDVETGKVASAKRPKLWLTLLDCAAAYAREPEADGGAGTVRITLPDGREVSSDDPDRDRLLSEALGRSVTMECRAAEGASYDLSVRDAQGLEAADPDQLTDSRVAMYAPPGTFFDTSTLHVLTTNTLGALAEAHPEGRWDSRRFRPNVLVELDEAPASGFAESEWVGRSLELGDRTRADVLAQMPRCVMTTVPQRELPRDPLILRTLAEQNRVEIPGYGVYACVGVLANISAEGTLSEGDPVALGPRL